MPPPFDVELALRQNGRALHQLARTLLADGSAADDVVADTFAAALQRPPRHAGSVAGWLRTAAANLARKWRRSEARRQRREQAAARPEAVEDAAAALARDEVLQRLLAAVRGLDEPYRRALWLRWFEELPPTAIAARLGEPLATVKSRLQRGLLMLRERLARDGGGEDWRLGLAAAFGIEGGAGTAAGVAVATGAVAMATGTKVALAAAALLLAAAAWWWTDLPAPVEQPSARGDAGTALAAAAPRAAAAAAEGNQRVEVAAGSASAAAIHLRGRAVAAESGLPLAGCVVRAEDVRRTAIELARGSTDAEGRFDLELQGAVVAVSLDMPGRAPAVWRSEGVQAMSEDLGDFTLARGGMLRGRVVDEQGLPVAGYTLMIWDVPNGRRRGDGQKEIHGARSDANGEFAFDHPLPAGDWKLTSFELRRLTSPVTAHVDPDHELAPVVVHTAMPPSIAGVVVDEAGNPVQGARIAAAGTDGGAPTGADGCFQLVARSGDGGAVQIVVVDPVGFDVPPAMPPVAWGTTDLRIVLPRAQQFGLRVVDDAGAPVEEFGYVCRPDGLDRLDRLRILRERGQHPGGTLVVHGVRSGANLLRVVPASEALSPSDALPVEVSGSMLPVQVVLQRRDRCAVCVVGAGGEPIEGAKVILVRSGICGPSLGAGAVDPRRHPFVSMPDEPRKEVISKAVTAADGTCQLWIDRDRGQLTLQVEAAGHAPWSEQVPGLLTDDGPWTVRLPDAGRIAGRVQLHGADRQSLGVLCRPAGGALGDAQQLTLQPDGSFTSPLLPVGDYRMTLTERVVHEHPSSATFQSVPVPGLERLVHLGEGTTQLQFEAPRRRPATLRGRVLVDGGVPVGLRVDLLLQRDGERPVRRGEFALAADGSFVAENLLPGPWRLGVRLAVAGHVDLPAAQGDAIDVAEGETLERTWSVTSRRLLVRLRCADGQPVLCGVLVRTDDWTATAAGRDGVLVFEPAPLAPIRFARQPDNGVEPAPSAWSDPVQMPQDRREAELSVILPRSGR